MMLMRLKEFNDIFIAVGKSSTCEDVFSVRLIDINAIK